MYLIEIPQDRAGAQLTPCWTSRMRLGCSKRQAFMLWRALKSGRACGDARLGAELAGSSLSCPGMPHRSAKPLWFPLNIGGIL